jgi:hypothetical protein
MTADAILADPRTQPWTVESLRRVRIFLGRAGW